MALRTSLALAVALALFGAPARSGEVQAAEASLSAAEQGRAALEGQRAALRAELAALGARIEVLKRALPPGAAPTPALVPLLEQSTALGATLDGVGRSEAEAEAALARARAALSKACEREQAALSARWGGATAGERPGLEAEIAALHAPCARAQTALAPAPALPAQAAQAKPTDDAQSLREKADFLRDREDALRRRIAQTNERILAVGREQALDRRVSEFVHERDLFDDDDRRLSVTRTEYAGGTATSLAVQSPSSNQGQAGGASLSNGPTPVAGSSGGSGGGQGGASSPGLGGVGSPAGPADSMGPATSKETLAGTRPEELRMDDAPAGDDESLEALRAERETLSREAERLHAAAAALEADAAKRR
ncbi:MAG: hypothetical protein ACYCWW_09505 [Deltaproteobacteria bacterium]